MVDQELAMKINGKSTDIPSEWGEASLLEYLRDYLGLTGTKFGCGIGQCGVCTVHVDGQPMRACLMPLGSMQGRSVTTIEGLASGDGLHPVQSAWLEIGVAQCGYCQPGQIMSASALLANNPNPTDEDIVTAMQGNICRCGTYPRIKAAIKQAATKQAAMKSEAYYEVK